MKIHEIGGEFALIQRLAARSVVSHPELVKGIGDDAAAIAGTASDGDLLLVTTDMLVEESHFRCDWSSPFQIGFKAATCNLSDIAAMGGAPTFIFVSLALRSDMDVNWVEELYRGITDVCRQHGVVLAGGDTTHGEKNTISITLLGRVAPDRVRLRSHARPGELLCVTGHLGGGAAGLAMLTAGLDTPEYLQEKHLAPRCRLDVAPTIASFARAMIDISDGLAAEVSHICDESRTGAEVFAADIPIHPKVEEAARRTQSTSLDFALSGGEDFELLFTLRPEDRTPLEAEGVRIFPVGRVTEAAAGRVLILDDGQRTPLAGGYNHFGANNKKKRAGD